MVSALHLLGIGLALAAQSGATVESFRRWASADGNHQALLAAAREAPDSLRETLACARARIAGAGSAEAMEEFRLAHRLARAYAGAWSDSFFVRQLMRFESWSRRTRSASVAADSLRRAGIVAMGRSGVPAALRLWRQTLRRVPAADSAGRAAALAAMGGGLYLAGDPDRSAIYLTRARDLARQVGDQRTAGNAVGILANLAKDAGELAPAAALYAEASAIRERSGDSRGIAADQNNLGLIAREMGDLEAARRDFNRALVLNRRDGRQRLVALNLGNLADLASLEGDYGRAETLYLEALQINQTGGDTAETGFLFHDLGLLALRRGDYVRARDALARARSTHQQAGAIAEVIAVRRDLATVHAAIGDLQSALEELGQAEQESAAIRDPALQGGLALARADLALQLGGLAEAERGYAQAERLARAARDHLTRGAALEGRGVLLYLRDDHTEALRLLHLAVRARTIAGDRRAAAMTRLLIGQVQDDQGDTALSRRTLTSAHDSLRALDDAVGEAMALAALGELALNRSAGLAAEGLFRRGLERLGTRPAVEVRWRLHALLGDALRDRGALIPSIQHFRAAVAEIEREAGSLRLEERRVGFLSDKWQVYASLALAHRARGDIAEAFATSEQMRARQMRDLLARGRIPVRREVSSREQDLRRLITELTTRLESSPPDRRALRETPLSGRSLDASREALAASQNAYAELLRQIREADPAYARLVQSAPVSWKTVAGRLKPDQVLLEFLLTDTASVVFVVTRDTIAALELDAARPELANLVSFARRTMQRPGSAPVASWWRSPFKKLHQHLIQPVIQTGLLEGKQTLVIVPHAELHFLPFSALLDPADRFLVERFDLSYGPSASVWVQLAETRRDRAGRILALAPHPDVLPGSREEVVGIRTIHGERATLLLGKAASESALRAAVAGHSVVHLASYGILNQHNPLFSFVELAKSGDDDGRLEVHEVFGLDLAGQMVVLSACQTGLGAGAIQDIPPGDDWIGLVQAFLHAGASGVLASLWPVEDRATADLMQQFYHELGSSQSDARALARAQQTLLGSPATAHPFYWAGFLLTAH